MCSRKDVVRSPIQWVRVSLLKVRPRHIISSIDLVTALDHPDGHRHEQPPVSFDGLVSTEPLGDIFPYER
jgi:hypothetical protein